MFQFENPTKKSKILITVRAAVSKVCTLIISILGIQLASASTTITSSMKFPLSIDEDKAVIEDTSVEIQNDRSAFDTSKILEFNRNTGNIYYLGAGVTRTPNSLSASQSLSDTPFQKGRALNLVGNFESPSTNGWSAYGRSNLDLVSAESAFINDGYSLIASAGASYAVNPKLKFSFGVMGTRSLIDGVITSPIVGLDWEITERLKLRTLNGAFLSYDLGESKNTRIDLSVEYKNQIFDVQNYQGTMFMLAAPIKTDWEEKAVVSTLGLKHEWKDVFSIRAFAELINNREFDIDLETVEVPEILKKDRSLSFGVEGGFRF